MKTFNVHLTTRAHPPVNNWIVTFCLPGELPQALAFVPDRTQSVTLPDTARLVHIWLYADHKAVEDDYEICQRFVAARSCEIGNGRIPLLDHCGQTVCVFIFDGFPRALTVLPPTHDLNGIRSIEQIYAQHLALGWTVPVECRFREVVTPVGRVPIAQFAAMTSLKKQKSTDSSTLYQLFKLVQSINRHRAFEQCTADEKARWLGDMLTLSTRYLHYAPDTAHATNEPCDQWVRLHCFPNPERANFDCEDGAQSAYAWYHALIASTDKSLASIAAFARQYSAFMAIGMLRLDLHTVTPHVYTVLLAKDRQSPAIMCESTMHLDPVWTRDAMDQAESHDEREIRDAIEYDPQPWQTWMTLRCPVSVATRVKMYMHVSTLLCHNPETRRAKQFACINRQAKTFGVPLSDLLLYKSKVEFLLVHESTGMHESLESMPLATLPVGSSLNVPTSTPRHRMPTQLVFPQAVFDRHHSEIHAWIHANTARARKWHVRQFEFPKGQHLVMLESN